VLGQASTVGIDATIAAWQHGQPWLDAVLAQLTANRARLTAHLEAELPAIRYHQPEGTYLAWLDCRDLGLPSVPAQFFLDRADIALGDGAAFGTNGATCVRLNFATSSAVLNLALERMAQAVRAVGAAV
jgi:cystathionine beta-lyase